MDKILIVDSSSLTADLAVNFFTRSGYDVMLLREGKSARQKATAMKPDLIIINSELTVESGYDLCKRLKSAIPAYIPILILSGPDDASAARRAAEAGADDNAVKNSDLLVLASKVKALLRIKHLSDQMKTQYLELEEKNRLLDSHLTMAMQVQRSLIRDISFTHSGADFYARYLPAFAIGGDYYDIILTGEDTVSVIIGDVSGLGIPAALLTAMLHSMVRSLVPKKLSPAMFLYHMNKEFVSIFQNSGSQMYVCMFYAVFNIQKRTVSFSNAGHVFPLHIAGNGRQAGELTAVGAPIGLLPDSYYEDMTRDYEEGDRFLFYTDGLCDNLFKNDAEDFINRLKNLLIDMHGLDEPEPVSDAILELSGVAGLDEAAKYRLDDVSLILCRMP